MTELTCIFKSTWFFSFKSAKYCTTHCCQLHCEHVIIFIRWQRWWKAMENLWQADRRSICSGAECKVLNCSTQEGIVNPPSKIRMLPLDLLDAFCPTHFVGYLNDLMSDLGKSVYRRMRLSHQNLVETCSLDFDSKLDYWNQMHFCRHILLAIATPSCLILQFKACIQANATVSSEFGGNVFSRFRFQVGWLEPDAFWKTLCWLYQQPHVWSWNFKVSWKACIQANVTVSSEFGGNVFLRFLFQVGWLEPDAFLPTHLLAISTTSCLILEF